MKRLFLITSLQHLLKFEFSAFKRTQRFFFKKSIYLLSFILHPLSFLLTMAYGNETGWQINPLGSFPDASSKQVQIVKASAIDIDGDGNIYIIDRGQHQLLKYTPDGRLIKPIGGFGRASEQFDDPRDINAHATLDIFIADYNNNRVMRFDKNLNFISSLTSQWPEPFDFEQVISIALSSQYDLFLLENSSKKIIKFSRFAEPAESFGGIYETYGQLLEPEQLALDGSRRLFVTDPGQGATIVFDYLGNYITQIEHPDLQQPSGIHWGSGKYLYIVNRDTPDIFIFTRHLKFAGKISLPNDTDLIVDVALRYDKKNNSRTIYILSQNRCMLFDLRQVEKK